MRGKLVLLVALITSGLAAPLFGADAAVAPAPPSGFLWRYATGGQIRSSPAVGPDGTVYALSEDGNLYAWGPGGGLKWKYDLGGLPGDCLAVGSDGTIYAGIKNNDLVALNTRGTHLWRAHLDGPPAGDPAIAADGTLYVGSAAGTLSAYSHLGRLRWTITLPGPVTRSPVVDGAGTVYLVSGDHRLYALTPWGEFKWSLPMTAAATAPSISVEGAVVLGTEDGEVLSVSPAGDIQWRRSIGSRVAGVSSGTKQIVAAASNGTLYGISLDGKESWRVAAGKSLDAAPLWDGERAYAVAPEGSLLTIEPARGVVARFAIGTSGTVIRAADGTTYLGGRDWIVYAIPAPGGRTAGAPAASDPWPQPGHDPRHSGRTDAAPPAGNEDLLSAVPDYLYLRGLSAVGGHEMTLSLLAEIRTRIETNTLGKSAWYVVRLLERYAGEGLVNPVFLNQKVINDFPDVRAEAAALLGMAGSIGSRDALLNAIGSERDNVALAAEMLALGALASDGDGASMGAIVRAFAGRGMNPPDNRVAAAAVRALAQISSYEGAFSDSSAVAVLLSISRGAYLAQVRAAALEVMRKQGN